jgi:hypothetical protein
MNALALTISDISIRQDDQGRYCLNDLHKAAGSKSKDQPSKWLITQQAVDLIDILKSEITDTGILVTDKNQPLKVYQGGNGWQGTFVLKPLVYAYAMWISAKFHLAVISAYDALVTGQSPYIPSLPLKKTKIAVEGGLSLETQDELKNMINDLASTLPKDKQASAVIGMWSALGTHFEAKALKGNSKLAAYKFIPEAARLECVSLLARLPFNDMVTLSNTDMTALIDSKVQERIQGLPAPDLSLDTINDLIDVKIKAIQGELMPKANAMNDDQMIVSKSVLKKALRKVCGSTFTIHRHDEITVKVSETAYQQSEMAFFESLTA